MIPDCGTSTPYLETLDGTGAVRAIHFALTRTDARTALHPPIAPGYRADRTL